MKIGKTYKKQYIWLALLAGLLLGAALYQLVINQGPADSPLLLNEIVSSNGSGLSDEDGDYSDWIELYNQSRQPINLAGWALTDDPTQPEKWRFPDISLGSDQYLVIFASGKDRRPVEGEPLHTNFRLSRAGEFLGLYNVFDQRFEDSLTPQFPIQFRDVAFGRSQHLASPGYLSPPTPGGANTAEQQWAGRVAPVEFSVERGFYQERLTAVLSSATAGAAIRYTTDGSSPTAEQGRPYTQPLTIDTTTVLRAVAYKPDFLASAVGTHSYIFPEQVRQQSNQPPGHFGLTWGTHLEDFEAHRAGDPVAADYEMDPAVVNDPRYRPTFDQALRSIPSLSLVTAPAHYDIYANPQARGRSWERPVSVEFIYPDEAGRSQQVEAGVRIQGGVGRKEFIPKHSFRLFFRGEYGPTKLNHRVFVDSPVERFDTLVLRGGVNRSYVGTFAVKKTTYTRDEWLRASQIEMSGVSAHGTFVHLYLNGLYWGLYNLTERPDAAFTSAYLGGEKEEWIVLNHSGAVDGPEEAIQALVAQFVALNEMEAGPERQQRFKAAVEALVDQKQFIDYIILNWYAGNEDWGENNWYAGRRLPAGQLNYFVWDGEKIFFEGAEIYLGKTSSARPNVVKPLLDILMSDPDFRIELADRLYRHLFNDGALSDGRAQARWQQLNQQIEQAIVGEAARWGDVRYEQPITPADWQRARGLVREQMVGNGAKLIRLAREAGYYPPIDPPRFTVQETAAGSQLEMDASAGQIYYTTDGRDPRAAGGAVAAEAQPYRAPLTLRETVHLKARRLVGEEWSARQETILAPVEPVGRLQITELMYHPLGGDEYEFIELKNIGRSPVDLSGMSFSGIRYTFPARAPLLGPGQFLVLVRDPEAFAERYPASPISGRYGGQLSNGGEEIALLNVQGRPVVAVRYDDENGWPLTPDGRGDSLVMVKVTGEPDDPRSWQASSHLHGTPGADDPAVLAARE